MLHKTSLEVAWCGEGKGGEGDNEKTEGGRKKSEGKRGDGDCEKREGGRKIM